MSSPRKYRQIRPKAHELPRFLADGAGLSREQAILQIRSLLSVAAIHPEAQHLIGLFQIRPEELAEAGVSYEVLRALDQAALFL